MYEYAFFNIIFGFYFSCSKKNNIFESIQNKIDEQCKKKQKENLNTYGLCFDIIYIFKLFENILKE